MKFFQKENFGLDCGVECGLHSKNIVGVTRGLHSKNCIGLECGLHSKSSGVGNALIEITVVERVTYVDVMGWCPVSVCINIHHEGAGGIVP